MISQNSGYPLFCKAEMSKRIKSVCVDRGGCCFLTAAEKGVRVYRTVIPSERSETSE